MKHSILVMLLIASIIPLHAKGVKNNIPLMASSNIKTIKGGKFSLKYQVFETHDQSGTTIDTVSNKGDYIIFSKNGVAYMNYKNKLDSIRYTFPDKTSVSFGDTPFIIANLGNGFFKLYQNEKDANGDYNSVTYLLMKDDAS